MMLLGSSAFAVGADLSFGACPGSPGATADAGNLDCADGQFLALLVVFQPQEALSDLIEIDVLFDLAVAGDLSSTATFWDFENFDNAPNRYGLSASHNRPASGCSLYRNTWQSGGAEGHDATVTGQSSERLVAAAYRSSPLAVAADEKLFGLQLTIDASYSAEHLGTSGPTGCTLPVCIVLNQLTPRTQSGSDGTPLTGPSVFSNTATVNGAASGPCAAVPARRHTWGQLKSLYR